LACVGTCVAVSGGGVRDVVAGGGGNPLPADPVLVAGLELDLGTFLAWLRVNSHPVLSPAVVRPTSLFGCQTLGRRRLRPRCAHGAVPPNAPALPPNALDVPPDAPAQGCFRGWFRELSSHTS